MVFTPPLCVSLHTRRSHTPYFTVGERYRAQQRNVSWALFSSVEMREINVPQLGPCVERV
jgi:hypothetical protein